MTILVDSSAKATVQIRRILVLKRKHCSVPICWSIKDVKFLQLMGTIEKNIFKNVRTETILKIYNTLVLPTFLYGSENWILTALKRRRIEAAEMKLLRPLAGYTLYDHKTNDYIRRDLLITGILDKIEEYRWN